MRKLNVSLLMAAMMLVPVWSAAQKWEGLAETPQMGWNSWNKFGQNISEKLIRLYEKDSFHFGKRPTCCRNSLLVM